ncbi:MAG: hypothetical protein LBU77_01240, partial [Clostridiales bacterium]|nr:hypothetical protein [Clostridiales bacterium]
NGVKLLSAHGMSRPMLIAAGAVISWGGFSIHAQAISFLGKTKIRPGFYLAAKLINAGFATLFGFIIYPVFAPEVLPAAALKTYDAAMIDRFFHATTYFGLTVLAVLIIGVGAAVYNGICAAFRRLL